MLEGETLFGGTLGVNIQQLCRHIAYFLSRFLTRARPGIAAKLMQWCIFFGTARITAN
ncbi:hypothetical protein D3C75_828830 [compost metagenome]